MNFNPVPALLAWQDGALNYFFRRELLGEQVPGIQTLWVLFPTLVFGLTLAFGFGSLIGDISLWNWSVYES